MDELVINVREKIYWEAAMVFLVLFAIVMGAIFISYCRATESIRDAYYSQSGIWYDALCLIVFPGLAALAWLIARLAIVNTSVGDSLGDGE